MDPVTFVTGKVKGALKWSQDITRGLRGNSGGYNPIEILKRLQREAFSDIMKLRDRQEKVERMLTLYKPTKGSPFQESSTRVHGVVDMAGAIVFVDNDDGEEQTRIALDRAGVRTGINSRFTFETSLRGKDSLVAELVACENDLGSPSSPSGMPLSLAKVMYAANVNDWFSAVVVPWGARCRDVAVSSYPLQQGKGLMGFSIPRPPILDQCHGACLGLLVKRENVAASLAEFVSEEGSHSDSSGMRQYYSTFGQLIYQISKGTTLTLLGLQKRLKKPSQQITLGRFAIPVGSFKRHETPDSPATMNVEDDVAKGSIALILESELDESTRVGGWIEMQNSNSKCMQWGVSMSDIPEEELGWGLSLGGIKQGPSTWDQFQAEAFLNFNMGKRCSLQPGIVYVMDGMSRMPALMFRSSWSL